ncbi:MAG: mechanosensitive ion channel [Proteobacteria bacterium]|nr:mechanosensitive ion channel [Pseudomonadota bacterium]MBU1639907.1 mechanosensitive ion channel [Pseudomonadota bacterium]
MRTNKKCGVFWLVLVLFLSLASAGSGEEASAPEKSGTAPITQITEAEINADIDALQAKIKVFQEAENEKTAKSLGVTLAQLKERTEKAQETLVFYNRQLLALKRAEAFASEKKSLEEAVATGKAFELAQLPPYSLKIYDEAIAQLVESVSSKETAQMSLALSDKLVRNARQLFKEKDQRLREIKAEAGNSKEDAAQLALRGGVGLGMAEVELARASLRYEELAYKNAETKLAIGEKKASVAQQRVDHIRANLHFDAEDLDKQLASIDEKNAVLQQASDELLKKLQKTETQLLRAQKKLEKISNEDEIATAKAALAALEAWRQACQRGLEQNEGFQQLLSYQKEVWKQRYDLIKGDAGTGDLKAWQQKANSQLDRIQQTLALEQNQQVNLNLQINQVEKQLAEDNLGWDMKGNLKDQLEALKKLSESTLAYLTTLSITNQMVSRFVDEVSDELAGNYLAEKLAGIAANVQAAWKLELMVVDDRSVTVGKISIALFLLVFGIVLAGYFTRAVQRHVLIRTRLSESAAAITEKLLYYLTICVVVLVSMRVVNIPLTAFAFLGGAMAIGVGFGGQKIISNFISGFILMAEQPVKVGDLIQVGDVLGKIEEIGARSTRVRTYANIHILVPNSYFLENNIINWTLSDKIIRADVTVGVVYGSPIREVRRLLMLAVRDHDEALDYPKPYVLFKDFGDNALIFTVYFWITVQLINDKIRIESDLRFLIDDLFRAAGIIIAFPQRDVHLDTLSPLQVELVGASGQEQAVKGVIPTASRLAEVEMENDE